MKKTLSLIIPCLVGLGSVSANNQTPVPAKSSALKAVQSQVLTPVNKDAALQVAPTSPLAIRVGDIAQSKASNAASVSLRSAATATVATTETRASVVAGLLGTKLVTAYNYFEGTNQSWEASVIADENDANKVWFVNVLFHNQLEPPTEFYGIVDAATKTITIPAGQVVAYAGEQTIKLCGITTDASTVIKTGGNLTATFDANNQITINQYIGPNINEENNGWYELFNPGMVIMDQSDLNPVALYSIPQGMLFQGWTTGWLSFNASFSYSPILVDNVFKNESYNERINYNWVLNEIVGADADGNPMMDMLTSSEPSLLVNGLPAEYLMPELTASVNGKDSTFVIAKPADYPAYYSLSGSSYTDYSQDMISGFTTANPTSGMTTYTIGSADVNGMTPYMYGTGISANGAQVSLIARYDKPLSTLYFEGVDFFLGRFSAPAQTPFTCYVVRIKEGNGGIERLDTIASSVIYTENVTMLGQATLATMSFTEFETMTDLGLPAQVQYLEIDDPFIVELTGFQVPNCELAVLSEVNSSTTSKNRAYFMVDVAGKGLVTYQYNTPRAMNVNLRNAAYPYLIAEMDEPAIQLDEQGTVVDFKLYPYYNGIWIDNEMDMPEWLSVSIDEDFADDGSMSIHVSATPLSETRAANGRQFNLEMKTWGGRITIPVTQGVVEGMTQAKAAKASVNVVGDQLELAYQDMNRVTISDVNGKVYGVYTLSATGKSVISVADLMAGVYVLQFEGNNNEVVKFVK